MLKSTIYDEKDILARIATGDEIAFRQLFHHYNKLLVPFVYKLTQSQQATDEVLQEVFLKIWLHRDRLPEVDNPKAYIVRIVSNESMNYLRKLAKDNRLRDRLLNSPQPGYPSPDQVFAGRETEKLLHEAIGQLPPACRQVYQLSREQDLRIPEIASHLQLSDSTVKNQLVKALRTIRLYIAKTAPILLCCLLSRF